MKEEIGIQRCAESRGASRIRFAIGLTLMAGLLVLGACKKAEPKAGDVVKNGGGMEFAYVPPGNFKMGWEAGSTDGRNAPIHQVTFAKGFYLGRDEVTQGQWEKLMGNNPSSFTSKDCGPNCPVNSISWDNVQEFIKKTNAQNDGYTYRLPSESEWEYACRAGAGPDQAEDQTANAWYDKGSDDKLHPVGQKKANAWGLFDMLGNVEEWVMDNSHETYAGAPADGSAWTTGGDSGKHVWRGGSYRDNFVSSTYRNWGESTSDDYRHGVRLVAVPKE
ncbi:MAG: formylglycine-generating enzyme family protein [Acidobacteriota bacterium]